MKVQGWLLLGLWLMGTVGSAATEEPWVLQTGPVAAVQIPLDPLQWVDCWQASYSNQQQSWQVYATNSAYFIVPRSPTSLKAQATVLTFDTGWTVVFLWPTNWTAQRVANMSRIWLREWHLIDSLPQKGYPVVFPSVLWER